MHHQQALEPARVRPAERVQRRSALKLPRPGRPLRSGAQRPMTQFVLTGLGALVLLAVGGLWVSRSTGEAEAISEVERVNEVVAMTLIEPNLTPELLSGDDGALATFDALVMNVVADPAVARVKLWNHDGVVVYSDETRLINETDELDQGKLDALRTGQSEAEVSDLEGDENEFEQDEGRLMEVYSRVQAPNGDFLLYETYFRVDAINESSRRIWTAFLPIVFGVLLIMEAVQIWLAWQLARRLRAAQLERESQMLTAIEASDAERRRIAADLHDGVVQDLVGASLSIAAATDALPDDVDPNMAAALRNSGLATRRGIQELRSLLVDIYPPNLHSLGLESALGDLLAPLPDQGIQTDLQMPVGLELARPTEALIYRTVQEALRNVVKHADAKDVSVSVDRDSETAVVVVQDSGKGFDLDNAGAFADGHLGLQLLSDLAVDLSAELSVASKPGVGTKLMLRVPTD